MRVIHLDSAYLNRTEAMTELIRRVNQQTETVILFLEATKHTHLVSQLKDYLGAAVGHTVQVAPKDSFQWQQVGESNRNKQVRIHLGGFWHQLPRNGQVILIPWAKESQEEQSNRAPSTQLLAARFAQKLKAMYQLSLYDTNVFEEVVELSDRHELSYESLRSYIAVTQPVIALDMVLSMEKEAIAFEIDTLDASQLAVKIKDIPTKQRHAHPLIIKETGRYYKLSIQHYQLHRTPDILSQLMHLLDAYELLAMVHSTSVDGLALFIQQTAESEERLSTVLHKVHTQLHLETVDLSTAQSFVTVAFTTEINQTEWTAKLLKILFEEEVDAEVLGRVFSTASMTCGIECTQVNKLKEVLFDTFQAPREDNLKPISRIA